MSERPDLLAQRVIQLHAVFGEEMPFTWIHTHGLVRYGFPELEIRGLPVFMMADGARLLNRVAQYMLDNKAVLRNGESMRVHEGQQQSRVLHFWEPPPFPGASDHYEVERLAIVDPPEIKQACEHCRGDCEGEHDA